MWVLRAATALAVVGYAAFLWAVLATTLIYDTVGVCLPPGAEVGSYCDLPPH